MKAGVPGALLAGLLLVAAGGATAGTEARPEVSDPRDVQEPVADVLAVWFGPDSDGVKVTVKVAAIPRQRPNLVFVVPMTVGDARAAPTLGFRNGGGLLAQQAYGGEGRGNDLLKVSFGPGAPATLSAVIPWSAYGGLAPGDPITGIEAYSSVLLEGEPAWRAPYDTTDTGASYEVGSTSAEAPAASGPSRASVSPSWVVPAVLLVACTVGGAGLGAYVARAKRRTPKAR